MTAMSFALMQFVCSVQFVARSGCTGVVLFETRSLPVFSSFADELDLLFSAADAFLLLLLLAQPLASGGLISCCLQIVWFALVWLCHCLFVGSPSCLPSTCVRVVCCTLMHLFSACSLSMGLAVPLLLCLRHDHCLSSLCSQVSSINFFIDSKCSLLLFALLLVSNGLVVDCLVCLWSSCCTIGTCQQSIIFALDSCQICLMDAGECVLQP